MSTAAPSLDPTKSATPQTAAQRGGFLRAVLVLVSGTALAHGITIAVLPLLSRLYSPGDFGLLAVFAGLIAVGASAACLRFDVAIPLPADHEAGRRLLAVSLLCSLGIGAALLVACLFAAETLAGLLGQPALAAFLPLVPIGVSLSGMYAALQSWQLRERKFGLVARTRIAQSAAAAGAQLGLGWAGVMPFGLLIGPLLNAGVACVAFWRTAVSALRGNTIRALLAEAAAHRRFPLYSAPEALANNAALQLPLIMIAALTAPAEAGYLMMAIYVMQAPMALIGNAINQVYLVRAPEEHRRGNLGRFTIEVIGGLLRSGVGPLIAIGVLAPLCFEWIFGAGWGRAGWLLSWMTPWFICQFLAAPVSMALHICGRQRSALVLQLFGLLLRTGAVGLGASALGIGVSAAFAISGFVFYLLYLLLILKTAQVRASDLAAVISRNLPVILAWGLSAAALAGLAAWWSRAA